MKSIQHFKHKIKSFGYVEKSLILQVFIVILVAFGSFLLGRLSMYIPNSDRVEIINLENGKINTSGIQ